MLTAVAVLLAAAFLEHASVGSTVLFRVAAALFGLGFLVTSLLSLAGLGQRLHQLLRLRFTTLNEESDIVDLPNGRHWIRVEATAHATGEPIQGVLEGPPVVAHTTCVKKHEKLRGIPRFSTPTGSEHTETRTTPFRLGRDGVLFATSRDDPAFRVVGEVQKAVTVDDSLPPATKDALAERDMAVDTCVWRGHVFEQFLRLREARVADGSTGYLFGPVDVEHGDNGTVVRPAGRFETGPLLSGRGWRQVARHVARRAVVLAVLVPVTAIAGFAFLTAVT